MPLQAAPPRPKLVPTLDMGTLEASRAADARAEQEEAEGGAAHAAADYADESADSADDEPNSEDGDRGDWRGGSSLLERP